MNAREVIDQIFEGRDDIGSLPIPASAKRYARRSGLQAMQRQPHDFAKVNAEILNPGKVNRFKNSTEGENVVMA